MIPNRRSLSGLRMQVTVNTRGVHSNGFWPRPASVWKRVVFGRQVVYNKGHSRKKGRIRQMGKYLKTRIPYENYKRIAKAPYFVDKTGQLSELLADMEGEPQFVCITRPRRFGKTVMANMVAAFLEKGLNSGEIFDRLQISSALGYREHLNAHQVIYLDFSDVPENCCSYEQYISYLIRTLKEELSEVYRELQLDSEKALWDLLTDIFFAENDQRFVFVVDEWDAVFHMPYVTEDEKKQFLLFLKSLFKSRVYVELVYMTGILPIAKYSGGSELNMFAEYTMTAKSRYGEFFGFTDPEVDELYERYLKRQKHPAITREALREWYDGYWTAAGVQLYNPCSVVRALADNQLSNYWTNSGPYDEIFFYVRNNIEEMRNDLVLLAAGEGIASAVQEYAAVSGELNTKRQIYSAMVVYGLLTCENGKVFIPNKELMRQFEEMFKEKESLGYVYQLARESEHMLEATLRGDTDMMSEILSRAHDTEPPILTYNHETELAAIVNLVYLSARDCYRVEREARAGKGYVDFIFYPQNPQRDCLILELKVDDTPEHAIAQIREKKYDQCFRKNAGGSARYTGRILAVGIGYEKKTKKHCCLVEEIV